MVNDSRTKKQERPTREVLERVEQYPELEGLLEEYIDIVENAKGDVVRAGEAEEQMIGLMRRMGQSGLQAWAERKQRKIEVDSNERSDLTRKEKKGSIGRRSLGE